MAFKMDKLLVVDVEATCWESQREQSLHNQEIIEIGIVELSLLGEIEVTCEARLVVRPTTSEVSEFCTGLTGLEPEDVAGAPGFSSRCEYLRLEFKSHQTAWASWGDFDRLAFDRQCQRELVQSPWGRTHFNIKALFPIAMNQRRQVGVSEALSQLGWEFKGDPHRALDDARNIARITTRILTSMRSAMRGDD